MKTIIVLKCTVYYTVLISIPLRSKAFNRILPKKICTLFHGSTKTIVDTALIAIISFDPKDFLRRQKQLIKLHVTRNLNSVLPPYEDYRGHSTNKNSFQTKTKHVIISISLSLTLDERFLSLGFSFAYLPLSMIHFDFVLRIKSTKKYK